MKKITINEILEGFTCPATVKHIVASNLIERCRKQEEGTFVQEKTPSGYMTAMPDQQEFDHALALLDEAAEMCTCGNHTNN